MLSELRNSIAVILLAAGGSSRMGRPKLAESFKGRTILETVLAELSRVLSPLKVVVLGANKDQYASLIPAEEFEVVINDKWAEGLSESIKAGFRYLESKEDHDLNGVLILLADMPLVSASYMTRLLQTAESSDKGIIGSDYGPSIGPPVIIKKKYFHEILKLKGDKGAKMLIFNHRDDLETLSFSQGSMDIDTEKDLKQLRSKD